MCSELFRIPVEWAGVPIFGFGVLLAIWLLGGGAWLIYSGKRTGWSAETMSYVPGPSNWSGRYCCVAASVSWWVANSWLRRDGAVGCDHRVSHGSASSAATGA